MNKVKMNKDNSKEIIESLLKAPKITQKAPAYSIFVLSIGETFLQLAKYIDYSYQGLVFKQNEGFAEFNYLKNDFPKILESINKKIKENPNFLQKMKKLYEKEFSEAKKKYFEAKSKGDLIKIFRLSSDLIMYSVGLAHIIEPFSIVNTHVLKDLLAKKIKDLKELNRVLNILVTPEERSFSNEYDDGLFEIFKEKDKSKRQELIQEHLKKYSWIKNSYAGSSKLTLEDINEQKNSLKTIDKDYFSKLKKEKQEAIKEYDIDKEIQNLANQLLYMTSWQDERKKNTLWAITEVDEALHEIAKKFKVDILDLYLSMPEEIIEKKFLDKKFKEEIKNRKKCFLWFFEPRLENTHILISGDEAEKLYSKFAIEKISEGDTINGTPASTGNAIGKVSICKTLEDIKNFKQGDVLVTSMTRPEYLPVMKKAAAIVTDEGGITCHAAIISRELGIPCVIGTKHATEFLHNGDLVEVKANHGAVRILKKDKN